MYYHFGGKQFAKYASKNSHHAAVMALFPHPRGHNQLRAAQVITVINSGKIALIKSKVFPRPRPPRLSTRGSSLCNRRAYNESVCAWR